MRIGVDLGGTKIEVIALSNEGEVLIRKRDNTPQGDYESTLRMIIDLVEHVEKETNAKGTVGVGIPGSMSPKTGLIRNANSTCLIGKDLCGDLCSGLDREVRLQNDANCFALSEAVDGAAKDAETVFGVIIGTGCGGAVIINQRALAGCNLIAGEWGHTRLPWHDAEESRRVDCYCGLTDCTETYLSGTGWALRHNRRHGTDLTAKEIVERARDGDATAIEGMERYADWMARGLSAVINLVDPHAIVLGGGLGNIDYLYEEVPSRWERYIFSDVVTTKLLKPVHGDSSGVRGAAWLWPKNEG
jgi:fructokinase